MSVVLVALGNVWRQVIEDVDEFAKNLGMRALWSSRCYWFDPDFRSVGQVDLLFRDNLSFANDAAKAHAPNLLERLGLGGVRAYFITSEEKSQWQARIPRKKKIWHYSSFPSARFCIFCRVAWRVAPIRYFKPGRFSGTM